MGAHVPARQVYDRIVRDFQAVLREYHSDQEKFDAEAVAKASNHFKKRLRRAELPIPITNLIFTEGGARCQMELLLDEESNAGLDNSWVEEI
jgi:hypothetical protein